MVEVFGQPGCNKCTATTREMKKLGKEFEYHDVSKDPAALDRILALGYQQVPVVINGTDHWSDFRKDKIAAL